MRDATALLLRTDAVNCAAIPAVFNRSLRGVWAVINAMRDAAQTLFFRSLLFAFRSPDRRSLVAGSALALVVWLLATYGVSSPAGSMMGLIIVVFGGAAAVLLELEIHCERLRVPLKQALGVGRHWICLQGVALLVTLACLRTLIPS